MNSASETYTIYLINDKLIELFGLPKKTRGTKKNYQGYFSLIFKWINKDKHDLKYIWFVVNQVYMKFKHSPESVSPGYFFIAFKVFADRYDPDEVNLPYSASREDCLKHGHTIESLPFHLLTTKERKAREADVPPEEDVTEEDREAFRKFLNSL
jgi:hypothetical protein